MPITAHEIESLLRRAFPTADIEVSGDDGVHMAASIYASEFKEKSMIMQHRMVYAALKGKMDGSNGELHALALTTGSK